MKVRELWYKCTHCSWKYSFNGKLRTEGICARRVSATASCGSESIITSHCGTPSKRERTNDMKNDLNDSSLMLREEKGRIDTALCFRRWKSEPMDCEKEGQWTQRSGKQREAGSERTRTNTNWVVFLTEVSEEWALENINRTPWWAKGQTTLPKINRKGENHICVYQYCSCVLVGGGHIPGLGFGSLMQSIRGSLTQWHHNYESRALKGSIYYYLLHTLSCLCEKQESLVF